MSTSPSDLGGEVSWRAKHPSAVDRHRRKPSSGACFQVSKSLTSQDLRSELGGDGRQTVCAPNRWVLNTTELLIGIVWYY